MLYWACWVAVMFGAALNSKALGASIVAAIALLGCTPNSDMATGILLMYVPAVLLSNFRD